MSSDAGLLGASCPLPITNYKEIVLAHGSGGKLSQQLIEKFILPQFQNDILAPLHDGAIFSLGDERLAFSTDSYVVSPIFFPGGDIGKLAVHGTVNDLAMCGARPRFLSVGFILEEGLPMEDFWRVVQSMHEAADAAGVKLVTGDTKVVDRGKADKIFINTSGIGVIPEGVNIQSNGARIGDKIIVSGEIAVHGIAIMSVREGLEFETEIASDSAALNGLVEDILAVTKDVHVLRDPTRGGITSALTEIAQTSKVGMLLQEAQIPISEEVKGACEILGLDPLYVANEGKLLAIVSQEDADRVLTSMRKHSLGEKAAIIGEVTDAHPGFVTMKTRVGGTRVVDMLSGEQLPRIC
ncbi:MAG: hydrogenase expression/formation protein HypE [Verrucomicrobiota bacterium]|nr:hydrogenase expression/formation protein HypE [Verrucomicrobiota bacterium]MDQ6939551.1 hydrogenase expression/formation protein HypE [Verrucomicrobiota bacterium]